jgi:hypothetical protein
VQQLCALGEGRSAIVPECFLGAAQPFLNFRIIEGTEFLQFFACRGIDRGNCH